MHTPLWQVFDEVLQYLGNPVNALETGCSYVWEPFAFDNLSTLNIAGHMLRTPDCSLNSIDNNEDHIILCEAELRTRNLDKNVFIQLGESHDIMCQHIDNGSEFNFFWLDTSEDSEHALKEYEFALELAPKEGSFVIAIDDYGRDESVKWQESSKRLKQEAMYFKLYNTATGLILGFYERG